MFDAKAIQQYHKRRAARLEERGIRLDFNDKHDKLGRFAPKGGGGGKTAEEMTKADIKVKGPKGSRKYISSYLEAHPESRKQIEADAKRYADAMQKVKNFRKDHPNAKDGSYNILSGKIENVNDGYCVTFHQNHQIGNEYGAYDDETYAMMAAVAKHELGSDKVYIGNFGNPEISFNCKDYQKAKMYCVAHNQYSLYDAKRHCEWVNDLWDESKNPIQGRGSNK